MVCRFDGWNIIISKSSPYQLVLQVKSSRKARTVYKLTRAELTQILTIDLSLKDIQLYLQLSTMLYIII